MAIMGGDALAKSTTAESNTQKQNAIVVNVTKVTSGSIPSTIKALGSLSAIKQVTVSAETAGRIAAINFKNGQPVAKGMPIVQLDSQQAQADYNSAVTEYGLARQKYQRSLPLEDEAISKQEISVLKADMATKKSAVQRTVANLNEKQVVAPFSGVLGAFAKQAGDYVNAGDPLVTLVNTDQLRADYNLPETNVPELKTGQLAKVTTSAYPNKVFYGTVTYISPTISQDSRMVALQALVNNSKNELSPGMFVHISQQIGTIQNAILVPSAAISADIKGYYVFKVEGNKAVKTYVTTGMHVGINTQITKGLAVGDTIVVAGQQKLEDGSTIELESASSCSGSNSGSNSSSNSNKKGDTTQ
ncbi:MAG: efflux transporter periplasmic adaptor subunit [Coxiella sp. (in: Bacteria)]|nr:MAG: efflux transporter periplasmic adaptor subunit [Coxiella sp. (in: g-proteobacteria)]